MGRIFCSITDDSFGWHETVCGNSHASHVAKRWGERNYQLHKNDWHQNGYDSFLVELAKYGLQARDMAANVNLFSKVVTDHAGNMKLAKRSVAGDSITLRFEMDTLVILHSCPHPLNDDKNYPRASASIALSKAPAMQSNDYCMNLCAENQRGFDNNALYHLGLAGAESND